MGRPTAGNGIDMESFIALWIEAYKTGKNQSDIARKLNVTPAAVSVKAKKFRGMGINLPELSRSSMSISAANDLMGKLLGEIEKEESIKEEICATDSTEDDLLF